MSSAPDGFAVDSLVGFGSPHLADAQEVVQSLNAPDTRIRNISRLQLLEPLESDICAARDFLAIDGAAVLQEFEGPVQERDSHNGIMGNILPDRQQVKFYQSETHYLEPTLPYEYMDKITAKQSADAALKNAKRLAGKHKLSGAALAKKIDVTARTVNGFYKGEHDTGIKVVLLAGEKLGLEPWQLFLPDLPEGQRETNDLAKLVRAYCLLDDKHRLELMEGARVVGRRYDDKIPAEERIMDEIFTDDGEAGGVRAPVTKSDTESVRTR